jgi:hypothetical protein
MVFRGKRLSEITEQDLQRLVDDEVQERDTIEYKSTMYGNSDEDKREMLRDITSMANHRGGYMIIGIEEDKEGIPVKLVGIDPGNHVERVTDSCLDNVDKRIIGLEVKDVTLSSGGLAVIVSIPESMTAPHMITYKGLNQFWKRHGRQKEKMTIDEIGEAFEKRLSNLNRLDRFLFTRKAEILESIGEKPYMVISSSPAYLRDEVVFDIHDNNLRAIILSPPAFRGTSGSINCGQPYPTINGLRADNRDPYWKGQSEQGDYLEVFRNGYVEYGNLIAPSGLGSHFASKSDTAYIVNFIMFIEQVYGTYLPMMPLVLNFAIYNANDMWLAVGGQFSEEAKLVKWQGKHLELEKFYIENLAVEAKRLPQRISDRIWQAFHRDSASVFDGEGNLKLI